MTCWEKGKCAEGTYLVVHLPVAPLSRYGGEDALLQHRTLTQQHSDVRHAILHDDCPGARPSLHVACFPHHLPTDCVPSLCLFEREVAMQLQVESVKLADLGMGRLLDDLARDVQLRGLRIEIRRLDADGEVDVDAVGGGTAGGGLGGYAPDGGGAEEVLGAD